MITIRVKDAQNQLLAETSHASEAMLAVERVYEDGDVVEILSDSSHLWVQMDIALLPGEVYLPEGRMTWRVPAG